MTSVDDFRPPIKRVARRPQIVVRNLLPGLVYTFVIQPLGEKERKDEIESATIDVKTREFLSVRIQLT